MKKSTTANDVRRQGRDRKMAQVAAAEQSFQALLAEFAPVNV